MEAKYLFFDALRHTKLAADMVIQILIISIDRGILPHSFFA